MTKTFYTLYIYIIVLFAAVTSCTSDDALQPEPARLHFSLEVSDDKPTTRTTGDPGTPDPPFVKPTHVYAIAVMIYNDGKTYLTYRHLEPAEKHWTELHLEGTDAISTYDKGTLDLRVLDDDRITLTRGTFYAIATTAPITLSGITGTYEDNQPTEVNPIPNIEGISFDLPADATLTAAGVADKNTFLRSAYNTPSTGYPIADKKYTVTARLYHTATRLDIQWDSSINGSGSVLNGNAVTSINVTGLPTTGIHAFTPKDNTAGTSPNAYQETITTNPSTKIMGREVRYVPSLQYYPLTVNSISWDSDATKKAKSTIPAASWNNLTLAPWLRIILK